MAFPNLPERLLSHSEKNYCHLCDFYWQESVTDYGLFLRMSRAVPLVVKAENTEVTKEHS